MNALFETREPERGDARVLHHAFWRAADEERSARCVVLPFRVPASKTTIAAHRRGVR